MHHMDVRVAGDVMEDPVRDEATISQFSLDEGTREQNVLIS